MGGGRLRSSSSDRFPPPRPSSIISAPPPSFLRRQEPRARQRPTPAPPLSGGAQTPLGRAVDMLRRIRALAAAPIPAYAGMTEWGAGWRAGGAGWRERGRRMAERVRGAQARRGRSACAACRRGSCLRRNDERGRRNDGWCARSLPPTPHLTSPLKGSPAKCPISADPPIRLYLVDIRGRSQICHFAGDSWKGGGMNFLGEVVLVR